MTTTSDDIGAQRSAIRRAMRARRAQVPPEEQQAASERLAAQLMTNLPADATLGVYAAARGEISLHPFLEMLGPKAKIAWPRALDGGAMEFILTSADNLRVGKYGILEPAGGPLLAPSALDVMLIPGTAFSLSGGRLGMGGGYYDRYLARVRPDTLRVGVAYHWQQLPELPLLPHDLLMTHLVSDKDYTPCTPSRSESARPPK